MRRAEQRRAASGAASGPPPSAWGMRGLPPMGPPSAPAVGPELLQRGDHQRQGQVRNGASKRPMDEADNSQQGAPPPPLRAQPGAEDVEM